VAVGTAATAPLSTPESERLAGLLRKTFAGRNLVLLGTPGFSQTAETLACRLPFGHRGKTAYVRLPAAAVTATRGELKRVLRVAAADRGIELTFNKSA
jgi:hypothetical protein